MINQCREYLKGKLTAAGIKEKIITVQKDLNNNNEQHVGAVLLQKENIEKAGTFKRGTINGVNIKRTKKFNRSVTFVVVIGEYSFENCEKIYSKFLEIIDDGINIDENYTKIEIDSDVDWVDKEDSILKSEIAVQILITFDGGVYKDTGFKQVDVNIDLEGQ